MLVGTVFVLIITIGLYVGTEIAEERNLNNISNDVGSTDIIGVVSPSVDVAPYTEEKITVVVKYVDIYGECEHENIQFEQYDNTTVDEVVKKVKKQHQDYSFMENKYNILIFQKNYKHICENHFLIKQEDESKSEISIYKSNKQGEYILYETREVELDYLRESLLQQLKDGIYADGYEQLNMILEDIES